MQILGLTPIPQEALGFLAFLAGGMEPQGDVADLGEGDSACVRGAVPHAGQAPDAAVRCRYRQSINHANALRGAALDTRSTARACLWVRVRRQRNCLHSRLVGTVPRKPPKLQHEGGFAPLKQLRDLAAKCLCMSDILLIRPTGRNGELLRGKGVLANERACCNDAEFLRRAEIAELNQSIIVGPIPIDYDRDDGGALSGHGSESLDRQAGEATGIDRHSHNDQIIVGELGGLCG